MELSQQQATRALLTAGGDIVAPASGDNFFLGEPHLVATFDFNYDLIINFTKQLREMQLAATCPCFCCGTCCCVPCFYKQNIEWKTRSQHVALTVDGIRFVKDRHPSCCGLSCTDVGKESKTVPYDKITDCDVQEPAGMACLCCVPNVLSKVHIDTASSGILENGQVRHELELVGLRYPNEFKQAVWSMKRTYASSAISPATAAVAAPVQAQMSDALLSEIRDELRQLNSQMREHFLKV